MDLRYCMEWRKEARVGFWGASSKSEKGLESTGAKKATEPEARCSGPGKGSEKAPVKKRI
jgi:hypothetical protein